MLFRLTSTLALSIVACACAAGAKPFSDAGDGSVDALPDAPDRPDAPTDPGPCDVPSTPAPTITTCSPAGGPLAPPASGVCDVIPGGGSALLLSGQVLTPGEVFRDGQVLVDGSGSIACVGCDCGGLPESVGATKVTCAHGVISPGLINAHEHITFSQNVPPALTHERYEHRHDWREGLRGHSRVPRSGGATSEEQIWGEIRFVMGGATAVNGSGQADGFLRNLDREMVEGSSARPVDYDTFPLGDSDGEYLEDGCNYPSVRDTSDIAEETSYTPHIAEGIDREARNEFLCLREGMHDVIGPTTGLIHGVALLPADIAALSVDNTGLIWSPRSNVSLYGDTARVTEYANLGVRISLGTDWVVSGSMNMLRELQCADELNRDYYNGYFTDEHLWLMVTRNPAETLAVDDALGVLAPNHVADIAIFDGTTRTDHRAVIDAKPEDVVLVLRAGRPLYGDAAVVERLPDGGTTCDELSVCEHPKRVCVQREIGLSLDALATQASEAYELFFCQAPTNEPSCVPYRDGTGDFPAPSVDGSGRYRGEITTDDGDGDGILDATDNCACTFNPVRPVDMGTQADGDADGIGDACDPCPFASGTAGCAPLDPNDRDGDGHANDVDNCPDDGNDGQEDSDADGKGEVCDACPAVANPGNLACPSNVYDVKQGVTPLDSEVSLSSLIVTGVGSNGFFAQMEASASEYRGPEYSGIFVYTGDAPSVAASDRVRITRGLVADFYGEIEITSPVVEVLASGVTLPAPLSVPPASVATGGTHALPLEGVLVRVDDVAVTSTAPTPGPGDHEPTGEFAVDASLRVDDMLYRTLRFPVDTDWFHSITGIVAFRNGNSKLLPRSAADLDFATDPPMTSTELTLVINEVDYDQPSSDTTEFIEIYNYGTTAVDLNPVAFVFVNGTGGAEYWRVDPVGILPAGGYLLIANAAVTAPSGVTRLSIPDSSLQNGPDGIAIVDTFAGRIVDAFSYEGELTSVTIDGVAPGASLVEGEALSVADDGPGSIARVPNGSDTNHAAADFVLAATPTPGAPN